MAILVVYHYKTFSESLLEKFGYVFRFGDKFSKYYKKKKICMIIHIYGFDLERKIIDDLTILVVQNYKIFSEALLEEFSYIFELRESTLKSFVINFFFLIMSVYMCF